MAYEIFDPLTTADNWISEQISEEVMSTFKGTVTSSDVFWRNTLAKISWAGLTILPSGVIYAGDSLQPGVSRLDKDYGAIFQVLSELTLHRVCSQSRDITSRSLSYILVDCVMCGTHFITIPSLRAELWGLVDGIRGSWSSSGTHAGQW